jgi:hypothetical protein
MLNAASDCYGSQRTVHPRRRLRRKHSAGVLVRFVKSWELWFAVAARFWFSHLFPIVVVKRVCNVGRYLQAHGIRRCIRR